MNLSELINEILSEWAYRVDDGQPNPKNEKHLAELSIVLSEMGLSHIKSELFENLLTEKGKTPEKHVVEADKNFTNPILNKKISYKDKDGNAKDGIVGNLLRLPKDSPGRVAAEKLIPPEGSPERDAMNQDLGGEGQPKKPEDKKGKEGGEDGGAPKEDPIQKAAQMFDPKADPAMAARMDTEKDTLAKIAGEKEAKDAKEVEKEQEPKKEDEFTPINSKDVAKEMPEADPETFNGDSDIPDGIEPEDLQKFNTDINKVKQIVDAAKAKGEKAPNINLCDITVAGTNLYCDDNLGIPREEMPQFKGKPQPGTPAADMQVDENGDVDTEPLFKKMLEEKGIKVVQTEIPSDKLKATQKDLVGAKVVGMMGALEENPNNEGITAPIYVSRDGFVIDGHHRWAAIAAYNAAHPDAQIPMKVQVIDQDIKDAIPMCNTFAEEQGVAAKKADANKETPTEQPPSPAEREPVNDDTNSKVKKVKGKASGEEIQTMEMEGGGFVYGTKHGNTAMVDDIIDDVKSKIPKERWGDIVFVGEGGTTNDETGEIDFNDEMDYAAPKFKELGAGVDTWDGDDMDVHKSDSKLYKKQKEKTGLKDNQILAGNWASMVGQGEGEGLDPNDPEHTMKAKDYLDDEGKQFLQDAAKEAGLPPIEDFDNPTGEKPSEENGWKGTGDRGTLYRLSFPGDNGDKETKINDIQVAFNDARDEHLIEKNKELTAQGKIPITIAGESHVDLVDKMTRKNKQKTEMKEELFPMIDSLIEGIIAEFIKEATNSQTGDWKLAARKGGSDGKIVYFSNINNKKAALQKGTHIDVDKNLNAKGGKTAGEKPAKSVAMDKDLQARVDREKAALNKEKDKKSTVQTQKRKGGSLDDLMNSIPDKGKVADLKTKVNRSKDNILNYFKKESKNKKNPHSAELGKVSVIMEKIFNGEKLNPSEKKTAARWIRIAEPTEASPDTAKFYIAKEPNNFKNRFKEETGGKGSSNAVFGVFRKHMEDGGLTQISTSTFGGKKSTANQTFVDENGKTKLLKTKKGENIASVQKDASGKVSGITIGGLNIKKMDTNEKGISDEERELRKRNNRNVNEYASKIEAGDLDFIDMDNGVVPDSPQNRVIVIKEAIGGMAKRFKDLADKYYIADEETLGLIQKLSDFSKKDPNKNPQEWANELQGIFSDIANHEGEPSLKEGWANFAEVYAAIVEMHDAGKGTQNGRCVLLPQSTTLETVDIITIADGTNERKIVTLDGRSVKKGVGGASALTSKTKKSTYKNDKDGKKAEAITKLSESHSTIYELGLEASTKEHIAHQKKYKEDIIARAKSLGVSDNFVKNVQNRLSDPSKCPKPLPKDNPCGAAHNSITEAINTLIKKRDEKGLPTDEATMQKIRMRLESYYYYTFLSHEAYNHNVDVQDFSNDSILSQKGDTGGAALARNRKISINSSNGVSILAYPKPEFNVGFSLDGRSSNPGAGRFHNEEKRK